MCRGVQREGCTAEGGLQCSTKPPRCVERSKMCNKQHMLRHILHILHILNPYARHLRQDMLQHILRHCNIWQMPQHMLQHEATYVATYKEAFEASVWVPRKPNGASAGAPEQARGPYRLSKPPAAGPVWSLAAIVHSSAQRFIVHSSAQRSPMQPNASTLVAACLTRNKKCSSKGWLIVVKLTVHMHPGEASRA